MATFGDFSSLLQLGVGTGVGLSLFRAPIDLRIARISRIVEAELIITRRPTTEFLKMKRRDVQDFELDFTAECEAIERIMLPFMAAAIYGALINLLGLIVATLRAEVHLSIFEVAVMLFVTVGWFLAEILALEAIAQSRLRPFYKRISQIKARRASPTVIPVLKSWKEAPEDALQ